MIPERVELRYFPILGRVEPLRQALSDAGVSFTDVRLTDEQWAASRGDPGVAGPFGGLPTLAWGDNTLAETLPIASLLARRLGQYEGLDDFEIARREAIVSNAYLEVIVRLGETLWADVLYPGADLSRAAPIIVARVMAKMEALDRQLSPGEWIGGAEPTVADFFTAEALHVLRYVLGPARDEALRLRLGALFELSARVDSRPRLEALRAKRATQFTARPDEARVVSLLRAVDLGSIGL